MIRFALSARSLRLSELLTLKLKMVLVARCPASVLNADALSGDMIARLILMIGEPKTRSSVMPTTLKVYFVRAEENVTSSSRPTLNARAVTAGIAISSSLLGKAPLTILIAASSLFLVTRIGSSVSAFELMSPSIPSSVLTDSTSEWS